MQVELLCKALGNGRFRGRIVVDGAPDSNLHVDPGTCEDLRRIWRQARDRYQVPPSVGSDCAECFPPEFLEAESEPLIDRLDRDSRNDLTEAYEGRLARLKALLIPEANPELKKRISYAQALSLFCLELYSEFLKLFAQKESSWRSTHDADKEAWKQKGEEIDQRIAKLTSEVTDAHDEATCDAAQIQVEILKLQINQHEWHGELLDKNYASANKIANELNQRLRTALNELFRSDKPARNLAILVGVTKALMGLIPYLDYLLTVWEIWSVFRRPQENIEIANKVLNDLDHYAAALMSWSILHQFFMKLLESDLMMQIDKSIQDKELVAKAEQAVQKKFETFCEEIKPSSDGG